MATLVLGAAGAAIGGPFGAAVGGSIGREIDRGLNTLQRGRLSDLRIQTSQYGDLIARIFGKMRVAGVVIWATDLVETSAVSKGSMRHGYSASFAVAMSCERIVEIGRIWADGRLIKDENGVKAVPFEYRLHDGDEDQEADDLIVSVLGEELAPAYRGLAYVIFEDFDLSTFGNRLPQLTIEIDGGSPYAASNLIDHLIGLPQSASSQASNVVGYAASGDTVEEALAPLCRAYEPRFSMDADGWRSGATASTHVISSDLLCIDPRQGGLGEVAGLIEDSEQPSKVSLRYFDPALDYAAGEKSARLPGPERLRRIDVPAALSSSEAKALAHARLASTWQSGTRRWIRLPLAWCTVKLGDVVVLADSQEERWIIREKRLSLRGVSLWIERSATSPTSAAADAGARSLSLPFGSTQPRLAIIELPAITSELVPTLAVVAGGGTAGAVPPPVQLVAAGTMQEVTPSGMPGVIGSLGAALGPANHQLLDHRNVVDVSFDVDPVLTNCSRDALSSGANLCWVDGELLQFATADQVGSSSYKLLGLLRGRYGTKSDKPHAIGSRFILLREGTYSQVTMSVERIGALVTATMIGADGATLQDHLSIAGAAVAPWSPVHLRCIEEGDVLFLSWVRRSRLGLAWLDDVDVPIGVDGEAYVVRIDGSQGSRIERTVFAPELTLEAVALASLGSRPWIIEVRQLGSFAASAPLTSTID